MKVRRSIVLIMISVGLLVTPLVAQQKGGYAAKRPVFGGSCATCPWGAMGDIVKAALKPTGWDVQMCYNCAGGPRAARMVADAASTPQGPVDFGATSLEFLQWAYLGIHDFAKDPQGARKNVRVIANIPTPTYFVAAAKADSGITDLRQIVEKSMPVKILIRTGSGEPLMSAVLDYYGLTADKMKSFGGSIIPDYSRNLDVDVFLGFGTLANAPEFAFLYDLPQKYDFKVLELASDLRAKLVKEFYLREQNIPPGLVRGVERPVPTVARNGTVIYGRTDMPDELAYTLAKAMDEHKEMLEWSHLPFSYNSNLVWKALDVPLHPGAARYYKEKGYIE
jgi:TRAP transporter TAXI family solute receptor